MATNNTMDITKLSYSFYSFHCGDLKMNVNYDDFENEVSIDYALIYDFINHEMDNRIMMEYYNKGNLTDAKFDNLTNDIHDYILSNDFLSQVRDSAFEFLSNAVETQRQADERWEVA